MNCIVISGNIGHTPEQRVTADGKRVCDFSLAIDTEKRDGPAQWVKVIAWEKQAEFVERFLGRGRKVLVQGRLQLRDYEGKDGTKKTAVEVIAQRIDFMDSKPAEGESAAPAYDPTSRRGGQLAATVAASKGAKSEPAYFDDDVAF